MKEILFDELTARDVAERLRVRAEIDAYLNAIVLTVARMNGCAPTDRIGMNEAGTGIIISGAAAENGEAPGEAVISPAPVDGRKAAK